MYSTATKPRVVLIIPSLQSGGAELFLIRLIHQMQNKVDFMVIVMKDFDRELNISHLTSIKLFRLNINGPTNIFKVIHSIFSFVVEVRKFDPLAVQCFLYPAELLSLLLLRRHNLFWSARGTGNPYEKSLVKLMAVRLNLFLSKFFPSKIVACSSAAADWIRNRGVPDSRIIVINNFLDEWTYEVRSSSNLLLNDRNLVKDGIRIGMAARFDPHKGHRVLIDGITHFCKNTRIPVHLTFIGRDTQLLGEAIHSINSSSVTKNLVTFELCGEILETSAKAEWFAALDLYVLASFKLEGFPNSLAEAISIGCPAISTSSGNSTEMLHSELIIQEVNPISISNSLQKLVNFSLLELQSFVEVSRENVLVLTDRKRICNQYLKLWSQ